jgi:hypothetical protein
VTNRSTTRPQQRTCTIGTVDDISFYASLLNGMDHVLRVPCLTAEQIEAEGWNVTLNQPDIIEAAYNKKVLTYGIGSHYLDISSGSDVTGIEGEIGYFKGTCRCINDLRLICKLLRIKQTQ